MANPSSTPAPNPENTSPVNEADLENRIFMAVTKKLGIYLGVSASLLTLFGFFSIGDFSDGVKQEAIRRLSEDTQLRAEIKADAAKQVAAAIDEAEDLQQTLKQIVEEAEAQRVQDNIILREAASDLNDMVEQLQTLQPDTP